MGEVRFDAAFPISAESKKTERSIKFSGTRHSGQSEKRMPEGKTKRNIGSKYRYCSERKLGITRRIK